MTKLNLGCGNRIIPGYVNIDCQKLDGVDICINIENIDKHYDKESVDVIYLSHTLEHFPRKIAREMLKKLFVILKENGILRLSVPDFSAICERYNKTKNLDELHGFLYSNHDVPFDGHYTIWDYQTMERDLKTCGFKEIRLYDWRKTDHSTIDDYSQSYLPHMDKTTGQLMSLNVEGIK